MNLGSIVLLAYAALMLLGGVMGLRVGSRPSLIAGFASGALLIVAWFVTRSNLVAGLWMGSVLTLLLCGVFAMRLVKTGKFMPAGGLLAVSIVALILMAWSAWTAGRA